MTIHTHTPTPWKISKPKSKRSPVSILTGDADIDSTGRLVRGRIIATGVGKADADFIVRACKAHEAMAHALAEFLELCPYVSDADPIAPALVAACIQARVALKLARGD